MLTFGVYTEFGAQYTTALPNAWVNRKMGTFCGSILGVFLFVFGEFNMRAGEMFLKFSRGMRINVSLSSITSIPQFACEK